MISIIVPIYKVEKYLNNCIESIINQSYKDIEIILVDDGSPDNCPAICDEYAARDNRIKVIHKENGGLMSARQAGLKACEGEYVGFVDSDDWIDRDMYINFADSIEKYHPDLAFCEFYCVLADKNDESRQKAGKEFFTKSDMIKEIYPTLLFRPPYYNFGINPCCWSKVFKKDLLEKNLLKVTTDIRIGEDAAFTYPCILDAQSVAYIDKPLYYYRDNNPGSMTSSYDINLENTILIPYEILKEKFERVDYDFSSQLSYYLLYLVNFVVRNEASAANKKSFSEKVKTFKRFAKDIEITSRIKRLDYSPLPFHTKILAKSLSLKNPFFLYAYSMLLRRFL